jgi:hypothetical protein
VVIFTLIRRQQRALDRRFELREIGGAEQVAVALAVVIAHE